MSKSKRSRRSIIKELLRAFKKKEGQGGLDEARKKALQGLKQGRRK